MAAGFGLLRLTPHAFWTMTPRELTAALGWIGGGQGAGAPPTRTELTRLMQTFPDSKESGRG